ncbi:hypothetical protein P5705_18475 [Pseudomonas entomophila]|uniref:hypothetical protein n=1 Tax=Pseudomonas entomophila TaxID=312306 RepID=UPI0024050B1F|nr:hypothetical protein [Pseudomonas entomophila]MDF9619636.1 hypothetical protein [Pseudomonas entomophila]
MEDIVDELSLPINLEIFVCPMQDCWTSFQLVDELGQGEPYAGLGFKAIDRGRVAYQWLLDLQGRGMVADYYSGVLVFALSRSLIGVDDRIWLWSSENEPF